MNPRCILGAPLDFNEFLQHSRLTTAKSVPQETIPIPHNHTLSHRVKTDFSNLEFISQLNKIEKKIILYRKNAPRTFDGIDEEQMYIHLLVQLKLKRLTELIK